MGVVIRIDSGNFCLIISTKVFDIPILHKIMNSNNYIKIKEKQRNDHSFNGTKLYISENDDWGSSIR